MSSKMLTASKEQPFVYNDKHVASHDLPESQGQYSNVFIQYGLHFKWDICVKRGEKNGRLYLIGKKSKCVLVLTKKKSVYLRYTFEAGVRTTAVYSRNLAYLDCLVFAVTKRDFIMLQKKHKNTKIKTCAVKGHFSKLIPTRSSEN